MGILEQIKYEYERRKTALAYENDRERLYDWNKIGTGILELSFLMG